MVKPRGGLKNKGNGIAVEWLRNHVNYSGDDCLPWPFCRDGRVGRGRVGYDGYQWWAHRLMCVFAHGEPPTPQHQAAHNCGKGHYGCVNPRHLEWKTNSENQLDRRKNGNMLRNRNGPRSTIRPAQIAKLHELRRAGATQVSIAQQLGVSLGCVQYWLKYRAQRGNDQQRHRSFTQDEDAQVRKMLAQGSTYKAIATALGRTNLSVHARIRRLRRAA